MYILWIDPWVRKLGYALIQQDLSIVDAGILLIEDKNTRKWNYERIISIYDYFDKFTDQYKIKNVGIEKLFFTKFNQANAEFVYGIRWALIMLFMKKGINIYEYTPLEIKKNITWNWKAEKILVQNFIQKIYWLQDLPEYNDSADALGLAYLVRNF